MRVLTALHITGTNWYQNNERQRTLALLNSPRHCTSNLIFGHCDIQSNLVNWTSKGLEVLLLNFESSNNKNITLQNDYRKWFFLPIKHTFWCVHVIETSHGDVSLTYQKVWLLVCLLIWFFTTFYYVKTGLPALNQYYAQIYVSCSRTHCCDAAQPLGLE